MYMMSVLMFMMFVLRMVRVMHICDFFIFLLFFVEESFERFFVAHFFERIFVDDVDDLGLTSLDLCGFEYRHQRQYQSCEQQELYEII